MTDTNKYSEVKTDLIKCQGLDPKAPYSLGNKDYLYLRECNSGHKELQDDEIGYAGGYYDGYNWAVPVCKICVNTQEEKNTGLYGSCIAFHLKENK